MRNLLIIILISCSSSLLLAQKQTENSNLSLSIGYGPAYSFFVKYEQPPEDVPPGFLDFYDKNRIGSFLTFGVHWLFNSKNNLELHYSKQVHVGKKNFDGMILNIPVNIKDFKLRHTNHFFEFNYSRSIFSKDSWILIGGYLLYPEQQEIAIFPNGFVEIEERNHKNSNLQEGGLMAGMRYNKAISGNFQLGIELKAYFTASAGYFETISLTPTLSYSF